VSCAPITRPSIAVAILVGLLSLATLVWPPATRAAELVVIELNGRTAEEVIPLLQPMLAPGGTISGLRDKLIIRTTPSNLAELRAMLDIVDAPPRRLLITVRQGARGQEREVDLDVSGSVGGDGARVTLPETSPRAAENPGGVSDAEPAPGNSVKFQARAENSQRNANTFQTLQVLEGSSAYIAIGQSIPIRGSVGSDGRETIEYRDVVTGFYATPRVRGNRVTVALATSADSVRDRVTGAAQIQRTDTVVSGTLGEWIDVGSVSENARDQETGIVFYNSSATGDQRRVYLKVEEVR